jgi:ribosome maturation factor RimP
MAEGDMAVRLKGLLGPIAEAEGFELVTVEVAGAKNAPLVRVYLDREGGLDIDAIASANAWVIPVLDEVPELTDRYTLEVSSPGIDRPLCTLGDFERFTGSDAKVTCSQPIEGRKHFTGTITGTEGESIILDAEGTTYRIPLDAVSKARLRAEIDFK